MAANPPLKNSDCDEYFDASSGNGFVAGGEIETCWLFLVQVLRAFSERPLGDSFFYP